MPQRPLASVLIPALNEEGEIGAVLADLSPLGLPVCVVDDGSSDGTAQKAASLGARVLRQRAPSGKGTALRRGLREILASDDPEWVLFMDGDGQHRPEEAPRFLEAMAGPYDFLLGSRMAEAERFPAHRRVTNRVGSEILRWMSGQAIPDSQCGFRAARSSLLRAMELESAGYEIETEILLKALKMGARWKAVPVGAVYGGQGSHFRPVADTFRICMAALRYVDG